MQGFEIEISSSPIEQLARWAPALKTKIASENRPSQKGNLIFQLSIFMGSIIVLGRVLVPDKNEQNIGKHHPVSCRW